MKILYAACAVTAPALAAAAAFAMPDPTHHFAPAADNWSPAPTAAPQFNLFGRDDQPATDNTCGYVSGLSGTYLSPTTKHASNSPSILNNLPQPRRHLRNKHLLRRPRLLQPVRALLLHHRHNMHPRRRHERLLHRRRLHRRRRHREMHSRWRDPMLQMAVCVPQHDTHPARLHSFGLHFHRAALLRLEHRPA